MNRPISFWPAAALLCTPLLALANLSISYALVEPACTQQSVALLHGTSVLSLAIALLVTAAAARSGKRSQSLLDGGADWGRKRFVTVLAAWTGALFTLVILVQWFAIWVLPPCLD